MEKLPEQKVQILNRAITRRQAIRAGGIAVVGLAFSKPLIETVMPKPAFAQYSTNITGKPSIEWLNDDIDTNTLDDVLAQICNVSGDTPVNISTWEMRRVIMKGTVTSVMANGVPLSDFLVAVPVGTLTYPPDPTCGDVSVTIVGSGQEVKVQIWARGIDTNGQATPERRLTITRES